MALLTFWSWKHSPFAGRSSGLRARKLLLLVDEVMSCHESILDVILVTSHKATSSFDSFSLFLGGIHHAESDM